MLHFDGAEKCMVLASSKSLDLIRLRNWSWCCFRCCCCLWCKCINDGLLDSIKWHSCVALRLLLSFGKQKLYAMDRNRRWWLKIFFLKEKDTERTKIECYMNENGIKNSVEWFFLIARKDSTSIDTEKHLKPIEALRGNTERGRQNWFSFFSAAPNCENEIIKLQSSLMKHIISKLTASSHLKW